MSRADEWLPPTPERIAKGDITIEETERGGREIRSNHVSDPLRFYRRRGWIRDREYDAGVMLARYWKRTDLANGYVLMRYTLVARGEPGPRSIEAARIAYRAAMNAIRGTQEQQAVYDACCLDQPVGKGKRMEYLRYGLGDLIRHFDIK